MLFSKFVLEDLSVGSDSIIGKSNIDEFFNHISMHEEVEEKSVVELAPSIEVASAYLIHMLETRFASLNPFMQYMFLSHGGAEIETQKQSDRRLTSEEFREGTLPKYLYLANSLDCVKLSKIILTGFILKIFLMKIVYQSMITKGLQKLMWMKYNVLLKRPLLLILMLLLIILDPQFSAPSSKALKKSTLGR
jgi:hypothetical protein